MISLLMLWQLSGGITMHTFYNVLLGFALRIEIFRKLLKSNYKTTAMCMFGNMKQLLKKARNTSDVHFLIACLYCTNSAHIEYIN